MYIASLEELKGTEKQQEVVQLIRNKRQSYGGCWRHCFVDNKHCTSNRQRIWCSGYETSCGELLGIMYNRYNQGKYDIKKFDGCSIESNKYSSTTVTCRGGFTVIRDIISTFKSMRDCDQ